MSVIQFCLRQKYKGLKGNVDLLFDDHFNEVITRSSYVFVFIMISTLITFFYLNPTLELLKTPIRNIKFFQISPSEYIVSTIKVCFYIGLLVSIPVGLSQLILFLSPGLSIIERSSISILIICSFLLFILGLFFSFFLLVPAALSFFLIYTSTIIEPFWSFIDYLEFVLSLILMSGFIFQLPILQIILSFAKILDPTKMINFGPYMLIWSVIIAAIITPSADPITQILLAGALFSLYMSGAILSKILQDEIRKKRAEIKLK